MDKVSHNKIVEKYSFIKIGEISLVGDRLKFNLLNNSEDHGFVYLWIECTDKQNQVVYVGKAGKTLKSRCAQHQNGFVKSTTGKSHSTRLRTGIEVGKRYDIYAKKSANGKVLDEEDISMACVEELAFIKKFNPAWNSGSQCNA
jgi:predicted GIY-YIG superfamily endonuclease